MNTAAPTSLRPEAPTNPARRVAMVAARALPFMGGIETHIHEVAGRLAAGGAEVTVLTTDTTGDLPDIEDMGGTGSYVVRRFPSYPRSRDYYFSPGLIKHLSRAAGLYDVVHVQGVHSLVAPAALMAAKRAGIPTVVTFHTGGHSSGLREALRPLQWRLLAPLLRSAAELVAVCEFERRTFARILGIPQSRIRLVRNGSEPLPIDSAAPVPEGSPLLLSVGRLEEYKGHHRMLQAMPEILRRAPGARLEIVGRGPYEKALRAMAEELGVAERVSIRGFGPDERAVMGKLVSSADAVCLLSAYEAHPIAAMEALGTGTKVLAADTSGLSELGEAGLATVIPLDASPSRVADAALAVAAAPRTAPPALPSWDDCAAALSDLYRVQQAELARQ